MQVPFEQCVRQHGATVLRVCRAALGDGADAEDAWSETFLAALKGWPGLAADANVEAWLVRIAKNKTIDIIRARQRRPVPTGQVPEPPPVPHTIGRTPGVWALVAQLPEQQRLAVSYHYLGGLPHSETAQIIGSSPAAVRRASSDGIRTLRRRLTANHRQPGAAP
ncbi:MAG: sigma-70 family RNA polymerase sigma factor [Brooklawnia sp.]|uniref:RNA polymerase sigma factor n=1 Tax=Brooklawnia sp. TaxID=2699740 RepID=UPI003C753CF9